MSHHASSEICLLTLCPRAASPVLTGMGLISGIIAW
jgi:hypothetical protein